MLTAVPKGSHIASIILLAALAVHPLGLSASGDDTNLSESISRNVQEVFAHSKLAVCKVRSKDTHGQLVGTGFFIDPMGTLVSTFSVAGESSDIVVENGDRKFPATRLLADPRSGIVVLKVDSQTDFLPLAGSALPEVATPVIAIGYALDLDVSPTFGTIAGYDSKFLGRYFPVRHLRANLPVIRGQAGSPLLDMQGRVVGIITSSVDGGAACHAVPASAIARIISDLAAHGTMRPGWLGLTVEPFVPTVDTSPPVVTEVAPESPAHSSGIQQGDILLKIGSRTIKTAPDAMDAAFYLRPGDRVELVVRRHGEEVSVTATVSDHPASSNLHAHSPLTPVDVSAGEDTHLKLGN